MQLVDTTVSVLQQVQTMLYLSRSNPAMYDSILLFIQNQITAMQNIATQMDQATAAQITALQGALPPVALAPASGALTAGTNGTPYTFAFSATGGTGAYAGLSISAGQVPPGLAIVGRKLQGTPTMPGSYRFSIMVTDTGGLKDTENYTLVIS